MFDSQNCEIKEIVEARKTKIGADQAWDLLGKAQEIIIGRGKKILTYQPTDDNKAEILSHCLGRTGNLRAPTLKIGKYCIIGFNEEMYNTYVQ